MNLTWLSEQTGVMESTLRTHYGRFIHASQADALELAKIGSVAAKRGSLPHVCPTKEQTLGKTL